MALDIFSEIDDFFSSFRSPVRSLRNEFIVYNVDDDSKSRFYNIAKVMPPFRTLFYQIGLVLTGREGFNTNELTMDLKAFSLGFASPFHILSYNFVTPLRGMAFFFTESFVNYGFRNSQFHKDFPFFWNSDNFFSLDKENYNLLFQLGQKMLYEYQNPSLYSENIIKDYLHIFLLQAKRIIQPAFKIEDNSIEYRLLQQFYLIVNNSYPALKSVESAARMLNVRTAYLWSAVKKLTNQSPSEIINQRILTEAKSLLLQSGMTISEIGYSLQFKEKSNFTRFFKNMTGTSPIDYTRQLRNSQRSK